MKSQILCTKSLGLEMFFWKVLYEKLCFFHNHCEVTTARFTFILNFTAALFSIKGSEHKVTGHANRKT